MPIPTLLQRSPKGRHFNFSIGLCVTEGGTEAVTHGATFSLWGLCVTASVIASVTLRGFRSSLQLAKKLRRQLHPTAAACASSGRDAVQLAQGDERAMRLMAGASHLPKEPMVH